jgi:hypothetical protein
MKPQLNEIWVRKFSGPTGKSDYYYLIVSDKNKVKGLRLNHPWGIAKVDIPWNATTQNGKKRWFRCDSDQAELLKNKYIRQ